MDSSIETQPDAKLVADHYLSLLGVIDAHVIAAAGIMDGDTESQMAYPTAMIHLLGTRQIVNQSLGICSDSKPEGSQSWSRDSVARVMRSASEVVREAAQRITLARDLSAQEAVAEIRAQYAAATRVLKHSLDDILGQPTLAC